MLAAFVRAFDLKNAPVLAVLRAAIARVRMPGEARRLTTYLEGTASALFLLTLL